MIGVVLVILGSFTTVVQAASVPQPTDCSDHHNQIQTYCGVRFLCQCTKMQPRIFFPDDLNPSCMYQLSYRGRAGKNEVDAVPFVFNWNLRMLEEEEEEEEEEEIWIPIITEPDEEMPGIVRDGKPAIPEDTDTLGCGTEFKTKEDVLTTLRMAQIRNEKGRWRKVGMPGNVLPILKSIHTRTDGGCEFVNKLPYSGCQQDDVKKHSDEHEHDDEDDMRFVIRVRLAERGLRDTVINTVDQNFRTIYSLTGDTPCFRSIKRDEILCHI